MSMQTDVQKYGNSPVTFSQSTVSRTFTGSPIEVISAVFQTQMSGKDVPTPECLATLEQPIAAAPVSVGTSKAQKTVVDKSVVKMVKPRVERAKTEPKEEFKFNKNIKLEMPKVTPKESTWDKIPVDVQEKPQAQKEEFPVEKIILA